MLSFISIEGTPEAVIQCLVKLLEWITVQTMFIVPIKLGIDFNISFVTVPIYALVHPLCVLPDDGGETDTFLLYCPKELEPLFWW